jgi:hypothetical protein
MDEKMNDRIKELIKQAMVLEESDGLFVREVFDKEKFAELIVKECAGICFSEAEGHNMAFGEHCGIIIKEHFGVDE